MAFADEVTVMAETEKLVYGLWAKFSPDNLPAPGKPDHITYDLAMKKYGTDKPDRRFGMEVR
jgi:aspartyl-tRNA synthetase